MSRERRDVVFFLVVCGFLAMAGGEFWIGFWLGVISWAVATELV